MNKIAVLILFFVTSSVAFSQRGYSSGNNPYDSLLFDGEAPYIDKKADDCEITVSWLLGQLEGGVYESRTVTICGQTDTGKIKVKRGLKLGDKLYPGQTIETTKYSTMNLIFPDGSRFKIAKNSKFTIPEGICELTKGSNPINVLAGKIWNSIKESVGYKGFEIETERCATGHRGTQYSIDVNDTEDIVRVYEGSVEVSPKHFSTGAVDEMNKLTEDLHNGKITAQEYMDKAKGLSEQMTKNAKSLSSPIIVEAGQQIRVSNTVIGDIVPISSDDDRWWEQQGD